MARQQPGPASTMELRVLAKRLAAVVQQLQAAQGSAPRLVPRSSSAAAELAYDGRPLLPERHARRQSGGSPPPGGRGPQAEGRRSPPGERGPQAEGRRSREIRSRFRRLMRTVSADLGISATGPSAEPAATPATPRPVRVTAAGATPDGDRWARLSRPKTPASASRRGRAATPAASPPRKARTPPTSASKPRRRSADARGRAAGGPQDKWWRCTSTAVVRDGLRLTSARVGSLKAGSVVRVVGRGHSDGKNRLQIQTDTILAPRLWISELPRAGMFVDAPAARTVRAPRSSHSNRTLGLRGGRCSAGGTANAWAVAQDVAAAQALDACHVVTESRGPPGALPGARLPTVVIRGALRLRSGWRASDGPEPRSRSRGRSCFPAAPTAFAGATPARPRCLHGPPC